MLIITLSERESRGHTEASEAKWYFTGGDDNIVYVCNIYTVSAETVDDNK